MTTGSRRFRQLVLCPFAFATWELSGGNKECVRNQVTSGAVVPHGGRAAVNVREVVRMLERDGWRLRRIRGSHRQYKHPLKPGVVTVPGRMSADLAPGTLNSILKQAGLKGGRDE